jgi:hypothetical protein
MVVFRCCAMTVMVIAGAMLAGMAVVRCGSARRRIRFVSGLQGRSGRRSSGRGKNHWRRKEGRKSDDVFHAQLLKLILTRGIESHSAVKV